MKSSEEEADILQEDLRRMFRWSQDWRMLLNLERCSVMHTGKRNQELSHEVGCKLLKASEEERDLGVIIHRSAKPSMHCVEASKKDNSTLGMIKKTIVTRDKDAMLRLYKSLVRPQWNAASRFGILTSSRTWKTGERAKKSHTNDTGLQGF